MHTLPTGDHDGEAKRRQQKSLWIALEAFRRWFELSQGEKQPLVMKGLNPKNLKCFLSWNTWTQDSRNFWMEEKSYVC